MKRFILASSHDPRGRLYWSSQRGWTYKELASLYFEPMRETVTGTPTPLGEPAWFEVEIDQLGVRHIIRPADSERPRPPLVRDRYPGRMVGIQFHDGYCIVAYRREAA